MSFKKDKYEKKFDQDKYEILLVYNLIILIY